MIKTISGEKERKEVKEGNKGKICLSKGRVTGTTHKNQSTKTDKKMTIEEEE